ncbi:hypothetical protein AN640_06775 [Candidatus Epulonipiscium fishelsonii]|uniref:Uncharacterized protein n=1 Tax=Candidatus Epulonipiscium fishelsonii TaxID=77094 RepID=A0ACC8XHN6_9FIRM|nr:hypothetical protein AN640_06775 [Epulopiscium sp. SCG-D08WGA-EpuloA1]
MKILQNYQIPQTTYTRTNTTSDKQQASGSQTDTYEKGPIKENSATYNNPATMVSQTAVANVEEGISEEEPTDLNKIKMATYVSKAKSELQENQIKMLQDMASKNVTNQAGKSSSKTSSVDTSLPATATTPEGAAAAIAPGGEYSVEAVSGRLMNMAKSFIGEDADPKAIEGMREAVIKGFEAAGLDIETGEGLPQICLDTFNETMKRFDEWKASSSAKVSTK